MAALTNYAQHCKEIENYNNENRIDVDKAISLNFKSVLTATPKAEEKHD